MLEDFLNREVQAGPDGLLLQNTMSAAPKTPTMLSDAFGTIVVRAIGIVLMFASMTLTARLLGPAEYGTYSAALALALLLATLAPMGTDRILVRNLSTVKSAEEAGRETAIAHLCTACCALLLLLGCLSAWLINALFLDNPRWAQTALLASIMFLPLTVTFLRQWVAISLIGTRRAVMPEQTVLPLIFTATMLVIAVTGCQQTAFTTSSVYAGAQLLVWLGSLVGDPLHAAYRSAMATFRDAARLPVGRRILDGVPYVSVAIGAVLSQSCMPLVIAATCGMDETAIFTLAMPYAALAAIPLGVLNLIMVPRCARYFLNGEFEEANHAVRSAATATFVLAAAISIVTWVCSPWLIAMLGAQYSMVCKLFPPLLLAVLVDCLTGPTIPVMQTMRMEKSHARALLVYIPIQLTLVCWFGRIADIEGAAMAYLLSRCLWNVAVLIRIYQVLGLVMLPYLQVSRALHEWAAATVCEIRPGTSTHKTRIVPLSELPGEAIRVA